MSKLVKDVQSFSRFFNKLLKRRRSVLYILGIGLAASIGIGLVAAFAFGAVPGMAILLAIIPVWLSMAVAHILNMAKNAVTKYDSNRVNISLSDHPILRWSMAALMTLSIVAACLVAFVPGINAFVMGGTVAGVLGFSAMTNAQVSMLMLFGGIIAAIPSSLLIQGLVNIVQDVGSCIGRLASYKEYSGYATQGSDLGYFPADNVHPNGHPTEEFSYDAPVFGAGGKPAATLAEANFASNPAPSFRK